MTRPGPLPETLERRAFTLRALDEAGVRRGRARAQDLHRSCHGVYGTSAPRGLLEHCRACSARLRPGQVFSHGTAARLHGLPLPRRFEADTPLHVAAVRPASPPRTAGVVGERLLAAPVLAPVDGLPVCAPSEAWVQLSGGALDLDELVEIADHLLTVSPMDPDATRALLLRRIAVSRRRTAAKLRDALVEARCPVLSPGETRVRLLLVRSGLPEPECNGRIFSISGEYLGRPGLVWRTQRVGLEYEGGRHTDSEQVLHDVERRETFEDHDWHVVRVTKHDLATDARRASLVGRVRTRLDRSST